MSLDIIDWLLVVTGMLDMSVAVYTVLVIHRALTLNHWMKFSKWMFLAAGTLYFILESDFVIRGLYHTTTWIPVVWNLMDALWMLGAAIFTQSVTCLLKKLEVDSSLRNRRKADEKLEETLKAVEEATNHDTE